MKRLVLVAAALIQGCAVSKTYHQPPELASVQGKVIYCETQSVHRECGYLTKQQERELRNAVDALSR